MPKVKLVLAYARSADYYDDYDTQSLNVIRSGITDWEDISEEDYAFLLKNEGYHLNKAMKVSEYHHVMILKLDEAPVVTRIESVTKLIAKMEADRLKEESERIAKKEQAALARRLKKEAKTKAEELALIDTLKKKHGLE